LNQDRRQSGAFLARLDSSAAIIAQSRQPLVDAARALLDRGFAPATPINDASRRQGVRQAWRRLPIGQWAKWTYTEGEGTPLRRQAWKPRQMPIAAVTETQKSGPGQLPDRVPAAPAEIVGRRRLT